MTISNKITELREKAVESNIDLSSFDDEDLILQGLTQLLNNMNDVFDHEGDVVRYIDIDGIEIEYGYNDSFSGSMSESEIEEVKEDLEEMAEEGTLIHFENNNPAEYHIGWWKVS